MCERIMVASNGGTNQLTIGGQPIPHEYDDARVLTRQLSAALRDALGTHEVVSESGVRRAACIGHDQKALSTGTLALLRGQAIEPWPPCAAQHGVF